jgi:hypothetical protein
VATDINTLFEASSISMSAVLVVALPLPLVPVIDTPDDVATVVGVPDITPLDVFNVKPVGSVPVATE